MTRRSAILAVSLSLTLGGCGIPADRVAQPLATPLLPASRPTSTSLEPAATATTVVIFLSARGELVPMAIAADGTSASVAVTTLLEWPRRRGATSGLTTAINENTRLVNPVTIKNGVATVTLSQQFLDEQRQTQLLAVAQLVYTVTALPGVSAVRLGVRDDQIEVPVADGRLVSRPVTRDDYPGLLGTGTGSP